MYNESTRYDSITESTILSRANSLLRIIDNKSYNESTNDDLLNSWIFDKCYECFIDIMGAVDTLTEAEDDHDDHMYRKRQAAKTLGKDESSLINKKYSDSKSEESKKRADAIYRYKEDNPYITQYGSKIKYINNNTVTINGEKKVVSEELLKYMKKHADDDDITFSKYTQVFKLFCNRYDIKPGSSLYVRYNPENTEIVEWFDRPTTTNDDNAKNNKKTNGEISIPKLPPNYILIHKSSVPNLQSLKPKRYSDRYINKNNVSGQYHDSGRVYFVVSDTSDFSKAQHLAHWGVGAHVYKCCQMPSKLYLDPEDVIKHGVNINSVPTPKDLVGRAVYVKSNVPIKVTEINDPKHEKVQKSDDLGDKNDKDNNKKKYTELSDRVKRSVSNGVNKARVNVAGVNAIIRGQAERESKELHDKVKNKYNKLKSGVSNIIKKKDKHVKESVDDIKMNIYEAEMYGDITLEERNELLSYLD